MNFSFVDGIRPIGHILVEEVVEGIKQNKEIGKVFLNKNGEFPEVCVDEKLFPDFSTDDDDTNRIFISGRAKSGKTSIAKRIVMEIIARDEEKALLALSNGEEPKPDKRVILFAPSENDPSIDLGLEGIIERAKPGNYVADDFANSIVIFDDTESLESPSAEAKLNLFIKKVLQGGRKLGIHVIYINHTLLNWARTKTVIGECNYIFLFPNTGFDAQIEKFNKAYLGLQKPIYNRLISTPSEDEPQGSRWVMISTWAPCYIMTEHCVYFAKNSPVQQLFTMTPSQQVPQETAPPTPKPGEKKRLFSDFIKFQ